MVWIARIVGILVGVIAVLWVLNTSAFHQVEDAPPRLLAHRGVHQTYAGPEVGNDTCTAAPIKPATHGFIENTLPSMQAAFDLGAEIVELDVHRTPDGVFAVFHDWTLDCRTDGSGQTNKVAWPELKSLDVGYGYSVDGESFPLRGQGVGLMPRLTEVFEAFPDRQFLINFKSNKGSEGRALGVLVTDNPAYADQVFGVYGGPEPTERAQEAIAGLRRFDRGTVKSCYLAYAALGWAGVVPGSCRDTIIVVPQNIAPWLWGWPHRFERRMARVNTEIILVGDFTGGVAVRGIDTSAQMARVPRGFRGLIWTNDLPALR